MVVDPSYQDSLKARQGVVSVRTRLDFGAELSNTPRTGEVATGAFFRLSLRHNLNMYVEGESAGSCITFRTTVSKNHGV